VNVLGKRSPLMLAVALEQIRRARGLGLADELRMERGMMRHCFHLRPGAAETLGHPVECVVPARRHQFAVDPHQRSGQSRPGQMLLRLVLLHGGPFAAGSPTYRS